MSQFAKETLPISLEEEMRRSYLDYAMSVIVGRALPDARDGLKPVHRRALFAMHELNNDWNRPYKKSARIVGDVIGKYHPHGDQSVYDTIVRMAQDNPRWGYTRIQGAWRTGGVVATPYEGTLFISHVVWGDDGPLWVAAAAVALVALVRVG